MGSGGPEVGVGGDVAGFVGDDGLAFRDPFQGGPAVDHVVAPPWRNGAWADVGMSAAALVNSAKNNLGALRGRGCDYFLRF